MAQKHNPESTNAPMTRLGSMEGPKENQRIVRSSAFLSTKWSTDNPILQLGEVGYETDTHLMKIGDGVTAWNSLSYAGDGALPAQSGNSGKFLTTDGTSASWASVDALPSQTGNTGKFLTTDGTSASWASVDALPSQTGNTGKFLTTDGTDASWATINALQNTATGTDALTLLGTATTNEYAINIGTGSAANNKRDVAIGYNATADGGQEYAVALGAASVATGAKSVAIGSSAKSYSSSGITIGNNAETGVHGSNMPYAIAIGNQAKATATGAIQIGRFDKYTTNTDANTFKVANANGNFEMMNANGNLPADRLASTSGLADGNYRLRLTMASGVPTLTWVAE